MTPLAELLHFAEGARQSARPFQRAAFADLNENAVGFALKAAWIKPCGRTRRLTCQVCQPPHQVELRGDRESGYWYRCAGRSIVKVQDGDLDLFAVDDNAMIDSFRDAIGARRTNPSSYAGGQLVRICFVEDSKIRGSGWYFGILLASGDILPWPDIFDALQRQFGAGQTILVCHDVSITAFPMPKGVRCVTADELFTVRDYMLTLERSRLEALLGLTGAKKKPGRKSFDQAVATLRSHLLESEEWPDSRSRQKKILIDRWDKAWLGKRPAESSLDRILSRLEARD